MSAPFALATPIGERTLGETLSPASTSPSDINNDPSADTLVPNSPALSVNSASIDSVQHIGVSNSDGSVSTGSTTPARPEANEKSKHKDSQEADGWNYASQLKVKPPAYHHLFKN